MRPIPKLEKKVMLVLALVFFACLSAKAGTDPNCDSQADVDKSLGDDKFVEFVHEGRVRSYVLHVSPNYQPGKSSDVIVALHGGHGSACNVRQESLLNKYSTPYIIVYPNGVADRNIYGDSGQHWNSRRVSTSVVNDVSFIHKVLDRLVSVHALNVNQGRIFAVGMSNGGTMAHTLAQDSTRFAAVVAISALLPSEMVAPGAPALRSIPVMLIAGTDDGLMPWNGGQTNAPGSERVVLSGEESFARLNAAIGAPPTLKDHYGAPYLSLGIKGLDWYYQSDWTVGGRNKKRVELIKILGGGHCWPGPQAKPFLSTGGSCAQNLDASLEAIIFFDNQPSLITSCDQGFTLYNGACYATQQNCTVTNGTGTQTFANGTYGNCLATTCNGGYDLNNGACYAHWRTCAVPNGTGVQAFANGTYGKCALAFCDRGFTYVLGYCVKKR